MDHGYNNQEMVNDNWQYTENSCKLCREQKRESQVGTKHYISMQEDTPKAPPPSQGFKPEFSKL